MRGGEPLVGSTESGMSGRSWVAAGALSIEAHPLRAMQGREVRPDRKTRPQPIVTNVAGPPRLLSPRRAPSRASFTALRSGRYSLASTALELAISTLPFSTAVFLLDGRPIYVLPRRPLWLTRQDQSNQVPGPPSSEKCLISPSRPAPPPPLPSLSTSQILMDTGDSHRQGAP